MSIYFKGKEAAGIFYIGTLPQYRGEGIAESMVKYILNRAKIENYKFCVLQASELGYPIYKKVGFKEYFVTNIYRLKKPLLKLQLSILNYKYVKQKFYFHNI